MNAKGVMTDERYNGQFYAKGNDMVVEDLEKEGFLVAKEAITHSYPHCWRCKHPIIYRATEQWFCSVDAIKDAAVAACEGIQWHPGWGKERMISMISERNDWCISRQRVWGVPIPIFYGDDCAPILSPPRPSPMWPPSSGSTAPTCAVGPGARRPAAPGTSSAPSAARSTSPKRPTSWTCGLTPAPPGPPWPLSVPT